MKAKSDDTLNLWATKTFAAAICSISSRQFHDAIRPLLAPSAVRGTGAGLRFYLPDVVKAYAAYREAPADDVAMLASGDSPELERYRRYRADLVGMDVQERRGTHANINDLESAFVRYGSMIRRAGEILQRRWGNDASDILNSALDDAERIITAALATTGTPARRQVAGAGGCRGTEVKKQQTSAACCCQELGFPFSGA